MASDLGKLMDNIAALCDSPALNMQRARWRQIKLIALNHLESDIPDYEGFIVSPLSATIYYSHLIAIVLEHKSAWENIAIIARHEVGRLSVD